MEGSGGVGRGAEGAQQLNFYGALVGIFELNFARLADPADARARLSRFRRLVDHNGVAEHVLEVSSGEEADQLAWRQKRAEVGGWGGGREGRCSSRGSGPVQVGTDSSLLDENSS